MRSAQDQRAAADPAAAGDDAHGTLETPAPPAPPRPRWDSGAFGTRFVVGLTLLPTLAAVSTVALYLASWPEPTDGGLVVLAGLGIGVGAWLLLSILFFAPLTRVESAAGDTYEQLRTRLLLLQARVSTLQRHKPQGDGRTALALEEAARLVADLEHQLGPSSPASQRWLLATGYVNLWRRVHQAEEALLELTPRQELLAVALRDRTVLNRLPVDGAPELAAALDDVLGPSERSAATRGETLARLDSSEARALIRQARHTVDAYRGDLWDKLVNLRNRLVATMFLTTIGAYGLLAVAVLRTADPDAVAGATAFFTIGAGVGLFQELYATSRRRAGLVFDYGLGYVRLLAVPVLSGIAAVGGVALVALGGVPNDGPVQLTEVYALADHPYGLIVAAIFGLTPGLFLERLRNRTDEYKDQIQPVEMAQDGEAQ